MKFNGPSGSNYRCDLINRYRESRCAFFVSPAQEKHWFCAKGRAVHTNEKTSESLAGHEVVKRGKSRPVEKSYNDRIALGGCYREWRPRAKIFAFLSRIANEMLHLSYLERLLKTNDLQPLLLFYQTH